MDKKGQTSLNDLPNISLMLLLAGVFFVVGIIILSSFQSTQVTSVTVTNENITIPAAINGTFTLAHYRLVSITNITNSSGAVWGAGNYSVVNLENSTVKVLANSTPCAFGTACKINYVYQNYDTSIPISIQNTISALSEIPSNWLVLIATVVAASIVIGIVITNLGGSVGRG